MSDKAFPNVLSALNVNNTEGTEIIPVIIGMYMWNAGLCSRLKKASPACLLDLVTLLSNKQDLKSQDEVKKPTKCLQNLFRN